MKYVCENCGEVIDEEDIGSRSCFIGYSGDCPCYEEYENECSCGGRYVEGRECAVCGEFVARDDLFGDEGICRDCINDLATPKSAIEFLNDIPDASLIVKGLFSNEDIIRILNEEVSRIMNGIDENAKKDLKRNARQFVYGWDADGFADFISDKTEEK